MGVALITLSRRYSAGKRILREVAAEARRSTKELTGTYRDSDLVALRLEFIYRARAAGLGSVTMGRVLNRDHTTILYHINGWRARKNAWAAAKRAREAQNGQF